MNNNDLTTKTTSNQSNEKESLANELLTIKAKFQKKLKVQKILPSSNNNNLDDSEFNFKEASYSELEKYCVTLVDDFLSEEIDVESLNHRKKQLSAIIYKYTLIYIKNGLYGMDCDEVLTAKLHLIAKTYFSIDYKPLEYNENYLTVDYNSVFNLLNLSLARAQYLRAECQFTKAKDVIQEVMKVVNFVNKYKATILNNPNHSLNDTEGYWNYIYRNILLVFYSCQAQVDKEQGKYLRSATSYQQWVSLDYLKLNEMMESGEEEGIVLWDNFYSTLKVIIEGIEQLMLFIENSTKKTGKAGGYRSNDSS